MSRGCDLITGVGDGKPKEKLRGLEGATLLDPMGFSGGGGAFSAEEVCRIVERFSSLLVYSVGFASVISNGGRC